MEKLNQDEWKELLMGLEKETLAELLIRKMCQDPYFCKEVYNEYGKDKLTERTLDQAIQDYKDEMGKELERNMGSAQYLLSLSYHLMEQAESLSCITNQLKLYYVILQEVVHAYEFGAGYEDETDVSLGDLIDECEDEVMKIVQEQLPQASLEEGEAVRCVINEILEDHHVSAYLRKLKVPQ